ncbi:hypothetical protein [Paenibacillus xerothermodurans]|uniref:hypothetical protein n=1 Tax=Paenibacillus xerothermodurans TaxID=1977292 RepID=UPI001057A9E8|nr:hypothetical protein [Paenibacillus xerothermodurans]
MNRFTALDITFALDPWQHIPVHTQLFFGSTVCPPLFLSGENPAVDSENHPGLNYTISVTHFDGMTAHSRVLLFRPAFIDSCTDESVTLRTSRDQGIANRPRVTAGSMPVFTVCSAFEEISNNNMTNSCLPGVHFVTETIRNFERGEKEVQMRIPFDNM